MALLFPAFLRGASKPGSKPRDHPTRIVIPSDEPGSLTRTPQRERRSRVKTMSHVLGW